MRASGLPAWPRDLWIPIVIGLLALALYWSIAAHFVDVVLVAHGPLGSDTRTSARAFLALTYEWKHPLMSPVDFALTSLFGLLPGFDRPQALVGAVAALAAVNVVLVFAIMRRLIVDRPTAALGAAVYALTFANLCILSVPESYAVSNLFILIFLLGWLGPGAREGTGGSVLLGGLAGLAGLCNVPLLLLVGLQPLRALMQGSLRRMSLSSATVGVIAVAMVAAAAIAYGLARHGQMFGYFAQSADYADHYTAGDRLLLLGKYLDVFSCFFLFAVATPVALIPKSLTAGALAGYLDGPGALLGALAAGLVLAFAVAGLFGRKAPVVIQLMAWTIALSVFYVFFKPIHAMVYSVQAQPALVVMATLGLTSVIHRPGASRVILGVIVALLLVHNLPAVWSGPHSVDVVDSSGRFVGITVAQQVPTPMAVPPT
jgi:hypothetical protein